MIDGHGLSFLHDVESHIRFLVALPVLIFAELIVHQRIRPVVRRFMERGVITPEETSKYYAAIEAALRARNSVWPELALVVFVYTVGHWIWRHELALDAATWYAVPDATGMRLTLAGYWYAFISIPIFQFILLRLFSARHLVPVFGARVQIEPPPDADTPRSNWRNQISGRNQLRFLPHSFRAGGGVGGADRQPNPLPWREPDGIQSELCRIDRFVRSCDSRTADDVHTALVSRQEPRLE